ncbi:DNRLRE domain-containing protein [Dactylosporangium sp. NPDC005555]|uniref:DNRLRE domain-containing protein n=1 Tax=Dactylosporangium sp. NPDC005555 TaxID=3154889 RepID=UPI0033B87AB7
MAELAADADNAAPQSSLRSVNCQLALSFLAAFCVPSRGGPSLSQQWYSRGRPTASRAHARPVVAMVAMSVVASLIPVLVRPTVAAAAPVKPKQSNECENLTRPDRAAAIAAARLCGKPVEVTTAISETQQWFAQPNGSVQARISTAPVRAKKADGAWAPIDLTLKLQSDGTVAPALDSNGVRLAGKSTGGTVTLASAKVGADELAMEWTGALPVPKLERNTATYAEVQPGVDLVVQVSATGFEQHLVVKDSAAAKRAAAIEVPLRSKTLKFDNDGSGSFAITDTAGRSVGRVPTPVMWDAKSTMPGERVRERQLGVTSKPRGVDKKLAKPANGATKGVDAGAGRGGVDLGLVVDEAWLDDPATTYPVTIDPAVTLGDVTDTYVKQNETIDRSGATDLQIGINSGLVSRTFIQWPISEMAYTRIRSAQLRLFNFYSADGTTNGCTARPFQVWKTASYTNPVFWGNQPAMLSLMSLSSDTAGYSAACDDRYITADVTNLIQDAVENGGSKAYMGLRVTDETKVFKQFRSKEATPDSVPMLVVDYDQWPTVSNLTTDPPTPGGCLTGAGRPYLSLATPKLQAAVYDSESVQVTADFEWAVAGGARIGGASVPTPSGSVASVTVPDGAFAENGSYSWRARVNDGVNTSVWSSWCEFTIDTIAPASPAYVDSSTYPRDKWSGGANVGGTFNFGAASTGDVVSYRYGLDTNPPTDTVNATSLGGGALVLLTPPTDGPHSLYLHAVDRAGNVSPLAAYPFNVGTGGITTLAPGANLAGKASLAAATSPAVTGVTYQWRRADTDAWADIPTADVRVSAGGGGVTWPQPTTGAGLFAKLTWNVEATLGNVDGPVQVRLAFTGGPGGASTPVKVNLDRAQASTATQQVGPGEVNLVTGNSALTASDVSIDSYGSDLAVSRTYNSRQYGTLDSTAMFGPGWSSGVTVSNLEAPYTSLTTSGSLASVGLPDGTSIGFTAKSNTTTGTTYEAPMDMLDLQLTSNSAANTFTLRDLDGNQVVFGRLSTAPAGTYQPISVTSPGVAQSTAFSWEKATVDGKDIVRPTQALAPVPAGVTCTTPWSRVAAPWRSPTPPPRRPLAPR